MSTSQQDKATRYRMLLEGPTAFVTPNPWDAGSARLLADLEFSASATSSGAAAGVLGRRDHQLTREEAMAHSRLIVEATDLPVSAGLETVSATPRKTWPRPSGRPGGLLDRGFEPSSGPTGIRL